MEEQKILNTEQINWYEEEDNELNYQIAFDGNDGLGSNGEEETESDDKGEQEQVDVKTLLRERDQKWKKRLKKAREISFAKGVEEGRKKGYRKAEEEIDEKLETLRGIFEQAHKKWLERHRALNPGLLDLTFDLVEEIVGIPVENPQIRETLEEELSELLHEAENRLKPVLWVSKEDYNFVENLVKKYAPEISINIRVSKEYNPGEFEFETEKKTVVYSFKEMLHDFRENISLPSWK